MSDSIKAFVFGDLRFDWMSVLKENKRLKLTQFELRILEYVVVRRPSEISTVAIATHLYGRKPSVHDIVSFRSQLSTLRKKLREANTNVVIRSLGNNLTRRYIAQLQSQVAE